MNVNVEIPLLWCKRLPFFCGVGDVVSYPLKGALNSERINSFNIFLLPILSQTLPSYPHLPTHSPPITSTHPFPSTCRLLPMLFHPPFPTDHPTTPTHTGGNEAQNELKAKMDSLKAIGDALATASADRLSDLEQANQLTALVAETHDDLAKWLGRHLSYLVLWR